MTDEIHQSETTSFGPGVLDGVSRRTLLKASGIGAGGLTLGASASPGAAQEEDEPESAERAVIEDIRVPYLDLDTLEVEFEGETLQAESYEERRPGSTTYVGEAIGYPRRDLFAAVSFLNDAEESNDDGQPDIVVYLCNGEVGTRGGFGLRFTGEFNEDGMLLTNEDVQEDVEEFDEDAEVKLALVEEEFLGAMSLPGEEKSVPFVATEATGDAGMFVVESEEHIVDDEPLTFRWIVLADGRQRGPDRHGPYRNTRLW